ncbi:receptor-type tyrosine-protein phosphatase alpha [Pseudonaja textilis]|uniref:receptor-type tyrosine-protein phosphatase alpha n=1 Tax=Pseudonaja textilis TaxID=8673 RepID=UPI000EA863E8|nr:receptor-type tyrosine-protein phosphatase alpha [Pseudonaja textilis]
MGICFLVILFSSCLTYLGVANITSVHPSTESLLPTTSLVKTATTTQATSAKPTTSMKRPTTSPGVAPTVAQSHPPPKGREATTTSATVTGPSVAVATTLHKALRPTTGPATFAPNATEPPPNVTATDKTLTTVEANFTSALATSQAFNTATEITGHTGDPDPRRDETPIIAVMVALSSLLIIVFIIIVLYMLRFKKHKQAGSHSNSFHLSNGRTDDIEPQSMPLLARSPSTNRKYPPLPVDKLEEDINRRMADDNKLFREEFSALPACPIQATCEAASKEENKEKNRYVNILPYDHSRVHLTPIEGVPDSDYINASFINGYQEKNRFIAAQGPKEETVNDFWRMIWEQNTATIVMVTNLKERKECKCAQYWPDQGCWTYGNIRVSVEDVTILVDYTVRKFCIQQVGDVTNKKPQRLVTQFHFTSWPDFGVPFTPIGMLKFLKKVKTCNPQYAGAIVVHCSAGVGRTGTFIVIDAMLDMMHAEKKVDVYGFVSRIRAQRCQMVQTDMQYVFIYQALLEHYLYGDTDEFNRVIIPVKRGEENTDYVNASFIDVSSPLCIPSHSAGAGRTGTFCALGTVLERVKAEGILDVFQTVKSLRLQRPHMVQTLEQYEFCYKVVQEYIDAFSDYANFK